MVATPRKRADETPTQTPRNSTRQSTTSHRRTTTRNRDGGTGSEDESIVHLDAGDAVQTGGPGTAGVPQKDSSPVVSKDYQVGDLVTYTNAPDRPMEIIEILGDRFRIKRLHDGAKFYVYRSLVVSEMREVANSAATIETGDCVRGRTATGKEITGFVLSVGRTCLKLTSGEFIAMDSVAVLARLPENLEQYCELPGKSRTDKLNELLEEYQFYNLSNWDTTPERSQSFNRYKGWEMGFYKGIEVDISKDDETWYTELKRHPEIKGNGDIYDYCVEAIDHTEGIVARLEEYERQATAQPVNATDNNQLTIIENQGESITTGSTLDILITEINTLYSNLEEAEQVAVSAAHSALEFARDMGDKLSQAKKIAGHGNWESVREQIRSPRTKKPIPSSTAALYMRIADRWNELESNAIATIREASEALKKPRLNPQPVADLQPVIHEKDLVDSLEGLRDNFNERKAEAEARNGTEIEQKYQQVEDIALPKLEELVTLYEAIGNVRLTRDSKGFAVLRPDLGNPFPLSFRNRQQAWDYWQRNKDKLLGLAERKPLPDYVCSRISGESIEDESALDKVNPATHPAGILASAKTSHHPTPEWIWKAGLEALGVDEFDLDPASFEGSPIPCKQIFTQEQNGLKQAWQAEALWSNFPYNDGGRPCMHLWIEKLVTAVDFGAVRQALTLVKCDCRPVWFQSLLKRADAYCFLVGAVTFEGNDNSSFFGSVVFYFGNDVERFRVAFGKYGTIAQTVKEY